MKWELSFILMHQSKKHITTEKLVISRSQLTYPFVAAITYQKCDYDDDDDEEKAFSLICPGSFCQLMSAFVHP